jgi:hypothetical protein
MSTISLFGRGFLCWPSEVPERHSTTHHPRGDWVRVVLSKRGHDGQWLKNSDGSDCAHEYLLEQSTGDLYGVQGDDDFANPYHVAITAGEIAIASPFYAVGIMQFYLIKMVVDVARLSFTFLKDLFSESKRKGILPALANFAVKVIWQIPIALINDLWHIARSPFYAVALSCAALLGILFPFEGRKWIGQIEQQWHDGISHSDDVRHGMTKKQVKKHLFTKKFFQEIFDGKCIFLAYCMLKRGNLKERAENGELRYKF